MKSGSNGKTAEKEFQSKQNKIKSNENIESPLNSDKISNHLLNKTRIAQPILKKQDTELLKSRKKNKKSKQSKGIKGLSNGGKFVEKKIINADNEKQIIEKNVEQKFTSRQSEEHYLNQISKPCEIPIKEEEQEKSMNQGNISVKSRYLIDSCSVQSLKKIKPKNFKDCNFLQGTSQLKRLLFLQFQQKQVYINESKQKNKSKLQIPKSVINAFKQKKSYSFFQEPNKKHRTEQTHDTSQPSNKISPLLSARSNEKQLGPILEMEEMKSENTGGMNAYYYYEYQQYYEQDYDRQFGNRRGKSISTEDSKSYMIDPRKIQSDSRTTLMIRNIPNQYTQEMLLALIDLKYRDKYDFFYLPIDYRNNNNVGYGFINFTHIKHIPDFYKEFNGMKWKEFKSGKICQLAYGTIQGTVNLVSHFQYSSVLSRSKGPMISPQIVEFVGHQQRL